MTHTAGWGRPAAAVAELQSAAAMLDPRFSSDHMTVYPVPHNSWIPMNDHLQRETWDKGGQTDEKINNRHRDPPPVAKSELTWQSLKEATVNFSIEGTTDSLLSPLVSHLPDDLIGGEDDRWTISTFTPSKMVSLVTLLVDGCSVSLDLNEQVVRHLKEIWPYLDVRIAISRQINPKFTYRIRSTNGVSVLSVSL